MATRLQQDPYEHIVRITHEYMGLTAERFIDRQIRSHLHKEPSEITIDDIPTLTNWVRLAVSLLTNDSRIIDGYIDQLKQLAP